MTRWFAYTALVLTGLALAWPRPASAAGVTKEQLDKIVKKLEANAKNWLKGEPVDQSAENSVRKISFDADSVDPLNGVLRSSKRDTASLYVAIRLLDRLQAAKPETIQAVLPNVKGLHNRVKNGYRSIPRLSRTQVNALTLPPSCKGLSTDAIMSRMGTLEGRRDQKVAREESVAKHNEIVGGIEIHAYRLMLLADLPKEDTALVKAIFLEERKGSSLFINLCDQFSRAARKMPSPRARKLCPLFRPHLGRIAMQNRKPYADRSKVNISRSATSNYEQKNEYAGVKILRTYNEIVKAAKSPTLKPVKVPSNKEIQAYHQKHSAPRR